MNGDQRPADDLPAHVRENRRYWDSMAHQWAAPGEREWGRQQPVWGIWGVPEAELQLLPDDMNGFDAVELGCGTGYVSAWMARRGARVTGIDNSLEQLATARRLAAAHGIDLALVHGNAEATPFADTSFDFAISEYGAAIWCDPHLWVPEAHRILRPGGRLVMLGQHPWSQVCAPSDGGPLVESLVRPYFGMHRFDWTGVAIEPGGVEFNLPVSDWFALYRRVGFLVDDYLEPRAPQGNDGEDRFSIPRGWARRYPSEQVWKVRKA